MALSVGCLAASTVASAGPLIDFSVGPTGTLGVTAVMSGGVRVESVGGQLYRWNGVHCCDHRDQGLGVLGPHEQINPAEPELNRGEWLRLTRPAGLQWTGLWFGSVNGDAALAIYARWYPAGPTWTLTAADARPDGTVYLPLHDRALLPVIWIGATAGYSLVWGVDLAPDTTVPEPATVWLCVAGLFIMGIRRRMGPV